MNFGMWAEHHCLPINRFMSKRPTCNVAVGQQGCMEEQSKCSNYLQDTPQKTWSFLPLAAHLQTPNLAGDDSIMHEHAKCRGHVCSVQVRVLSRIGWAQISRQKHSSACNVLHHVAPTLPPEPRVRSMAKPTLVRDICQGYASGALHQRCAQEVTEDPAATLATARWC